MNSERSPLLEDREVIHRAPSRITHDSITLRGQHSYEHATHIEIDCCFGNNPTSPEKLESVLVPKHCKFIQKPRWARTERNERGGGWLTKEYDVEESDNTDSAGKHCYGLEDMETKPPTRVNPHASWCPEYVGLLERGLNKLTCNRFTEKFRSPRWRACAITSTGVVAFILSGIICSQACTEE